MIPGVSIDQVVVGGGVLAVAAIVFAESGLLAGFFLPGDSLIFTAGFLVSQHVFQFNIWLLCGILFLAAILGDTVGYEFGKHYGRKLEKRPDGRIFKRKYLLQAEEFYVKHGKAAIILARFVPVVRTFAPIVAGASKMTYHHFIASNIIGAAGWTFGITFAGYFLGKEFDRLGLSIDQVLLPVIMVIVLISFLPVIGHLALMQYKKRRAAKLADTNIKPDENKLN